MQTVEAMKDKQRLRNRHRWGEAEETQPLKAMWDPALDPGTEKAHNEEISWTLSKHYGLMNTLSATFILSFLSLCYFM